MTPEGRKAKLDILYESFDPDIVVGCAFSHHNACDCREAKVAADVRWLLSEIERLETEVKQHGVMEYKAGHSDAITYVRTILARAFPQTFRDSEC